MKFIFYLTLMIICCFEANAFELRDSVVADSSLKDSLTLKVSFYLQEALSTSAEKPEEAIENYRSALLTAPVRDELWEAGIRTEMGKLSLRLKSKEAIVQLLKACSIYEKHSDLKGQAEAMALLARVYQSNGLTAEAQKVYTDLYSVQLEWGEAVLAGNTASYVSDLFIKKKNYKEAFKYADLAKIAYDKVCRRDSLGAIYLKIARIKRQEKKIRLAEFYVISKALPFYSSADDFKGRIKSFEFLAGMYRDLKLYSQAKWFYLQAKTQALAINDTLSTITSLLNLSVLKTITGELAMAKEDLAKAELLSKEEKYTCLTNSYKVRYRTLFKKLDPENVVVTL